MHSYTEKSALLERRRHHLESLVNQTDYITAYHPSQLGRLLNLLEERFMNWLTTGSMPRVSKALQGDAEVWKVYDPIANRTRYFAEENDLRIWMEARYYQ